ncbi:hypothetical protein NKG05_02750 [Oerskovia sp. M15]
MLKKDCETLRRVVESAVADERSAAAQQVEAMRVTLAGSARFQEATDQARTAVEEKIDGVFVRLESARLIAQIREIGREFADETYGRLLDLLEAPTVPPTPVPGGTEAHTPPSGADVGRHPVSRRSRTARRCPGDRGTGRRLPRRLPHNAAHHDSRRKADHSLMDTSTLKSFAPKARTALIADVTARVAAVLAATSAERVELPTAVARLERAVEDAGGGVAGRAAVAERVAYTWFNRIVALRFMDANGYTGLESSPHLVGRRRVSRRSWPGPCRCHRRRRRGASDGGQGHRAPGRHAPLARPQGEAYAALLEAYCRSWAETMPDMFGSGGDETGLSSP